MKSTILFLLSFFAVGSASACEDLLSAELERFDSAFAMVGKIRSEVHSLPHRFVAEHALDKAVLAPAEAIHGTLEELLRKWNPDVPASQAETQRALKPIRPKVERLAEESRIWRDREFANRTDDFASIRGDRHMLLPNKVYRVVTDRGEVLRVRFSRELVEDFFWQTRNLISAEAADKAIEAVARGFLRSGCTGASGVCILPAAIGGENIYKIRLIGKAIGAHRVYGLLSPDGVIGFVTHENEELHDSKYLRRVADRAIKAHRAVWP